MNGLHHSEKNAQRSVASAFKSRAEAVVIPLSMVCGSGTLRVPVVAKVQSRPVRQPCVLEIIPKSPEVIHHWVGSPGRIGEAIIADNSDQIGWHGRKSSQSLNTATHSVIPSHKLQVLLAGLPCFGSYCMRSSRSNTQSYVGPA